MEFIKGESGFTLEFNENEEANLERFISTLKAHDEFSHITSNMEFIAIILNEGVASLQRRTNQFAEKLEPKSLNPLHDLLDTLLNQGLAALQYESIPSNSRKRIPISFDELLTLLPDFDSLFLELNKSIEMINSPEVPEKPNTLQLENHSENTEGLS